MSSTEKTDPCAQDRQEPRPIKARVSSTRQEIVFDVSGLTPQQVEDVRAVVTALGQRLFTDGELRRLMDVCTHAEIGEEARRRIARAAS